jgi:serine/threonine protein kinase
MANAGAAAPKTLLQAGSLQQAKINNYKAAVEGGKGKHEREHRGRLQRYQSFEAYAAGVGKEAADAKDSASFFEAAEKAAAREDQALQNFTERERRGVLAKCKTWATTDFEGLKVLGEGAFGVVHLVRHKGTSEHFALKQVKKVACRRKNHRQGAFAERDLLAEARSRWFVELYATFQDAENVYMVMEFLQGGDLVGHLINKSRFTKEETRFYMGELLEGLDTVHRCGFVHRDVKPDNMVLDDRGHLKLLDFGLCKQYQVPAAKEDSSALGINAFAKAGLMKETKDSSRRAQLKSIVGTPHYMAPEVFQGNSGIEADLWSLGVITFECLAGHVPFHAGDLTGVDQIKKVRDKVLNHKDNTPLYLARAVQKGRLAPPAQRLLQGLLREREKRLTAEQIRRDPFFFGVDFARLHLETPPIVPQVSGPGDAAYFDDFDEHELPQNACSWRKDAALEWAHYEFDRDAYELQRPVIDAKELSNFFVDGSKAAQTQQIVEGRS